MELLSSIIIERRALMTDVAHEAYARFMLQKSLPPHSDSVTVIQLYEELIDFRNAGNKLPSMVAGMSTFEKSEFYSLSPGSSLF